MLILKFSQIWPVGSYFNLACLFGMHPWSNHHLSLCSNWIILYFLCLSLELAISPLNHHVNCGKKIKFIFYTCPSLFSSPFSNLSHESLVWTWFSLFLVREKILISSFTLKLFWKDCIIFFTVVYIFKEEHRKQYSIKN